MQRLRNRRTAPSIEREQPAAQARFDVARMAADLRREVRGEVRFDDGSRALYATDASNYRQVPIGVVIPADVEDIVHAVAVARRHGAPVLTRGGGTSLAGQCCNVAVVIDTSKYLNHVLEIDPDRRIGRVEPGTILDTLRDRAERHHLTFGPDPATHNHCTLGGMIGNNSCGVHAQMAGCVAANIEELDVLTYDGLRMRVGPTAEDEIERIIAGGGRRGEIYRGLRDLRDRYADLIRRRYPKIPRRISGYNLDQLVPESGFNVARALVGTEATCVTVLEATTRLVHSPPARVLLVVGYPDVYAAGDDVPRVREFEPIGLEAFDEHLIQNLRKKGLHPEDAELLPEGGGWLMVEFGGDTRQEASERAHAAMGALRGAGGIVSMRPFEDPRQAAKIWEIRESGLGATARVPGQADTWPGWEDSAVPPDRVGDYLRDLRRLFDQYGYDASLYGHFGQGCIHCRIDFDLLTAEGIRKYRSFVSEAADVVVRYGGSLSGEHGDGQARAELLPKMFGDELVQAFREFKSIWDPDGKMNPGKVVDPYRLDQNLRLGTDYRPARPTTHFQFPDDDYSFDRAALRCVGVGKCRHDGGGTMCPSYMVTREEKHATRGRARLLFEMLQGDPVSGGWRDEHVKEALDLCLACKGCKGDCPVNVDMATYKAEFLSHYYHRRLRPRSAYTLGLIYWWSRLAAWMPGVANLTTHAPLAGRLVKSMAGVAQPRGMPSFAPQTFKEWFRHRGAPADTAGQRIILWPDTFNNHFHPETAAAAVDVLEAAGYRVIVPQGSLCCGRPLYDYGFLDQAKGLLREVLDALRPEIRAGTPVVGLEPSCVAVFRDELINLFPHDPDAQRLNRQTFLLGEFLEREGYQPPPLRRRAVVHGHCHHKAVLDFGADEKVLGRLGLEYRVLDSGCCGMAGSFGFEQGDRYDVSVRAGERVLLPAVREAGDDTLIITDGFSCREQIAQGTERRALHLAQVLQMALREGEGGPAGAHPEAGYQKLRPQGPPWARAGVRGTAALVGATAAAAGVLAWALTRRR